MKAVPKVSTDGLYIEDVIADDAFSGVVPFYITPEFDPETEEPPEPIIAGYKVSIPATPGLFRPRFDLEAWEKFSDAKNAADKKYAKEYTAWSKLPDDDRGDPPQKPIIPEPTLWIEGMTPDEIAEITKPQPQELTESDKKIANLETQLTLQTEQTFIALDAVANLFEQLLDVQMQLAAITGGGE
jgi:hypothetical protein